MSEERSLSTIGGVGARLVPITIMVATQAWSKLRRSAAVWNAICKHRGAYSWSCSAASPHYSHAAVGVGTSAPQTG